MNQDLYQRGLEIRKAVLGKEYVEKSLAGADDFSRPMQELATEYCWGRTREEIREVLLQVAIYCGIPAGIDSVRIAREAFAEIDATGR